MNKNPTKESGPHFAHAAFTGRIGVERIDITPPIGIYNRRWGASAYDVAEGVHRPLTATVLSLQRSHGNDPLILVALDLSWMDRAEDERYLRSALLDALKLDESRLMMNFAHSHAVPPTNRAKADQPGGELTAPYLDKLRNDVASAAKRSMESAVQATLEWTTGRCSLAAFRDLPDPEADRILTGFYPGHPADDTVLVGRVADPGGKVTATLINYACHPTTLAWQNLLISPDFVGTTREVVEAATGEAPCLFLQGASGELAPMEQYTGDTEIADRNGRQLGYAALSALEGMLPPATRLVYDGVVESGAPLGTYRRVPLVPGEQTNRLDAECRQVELELKELPTLAELEEQLKNEADRAMSERIRRQMTIRGELGDHETTLMPLWVWCVGEAILVGHPYESYSHLQTELREKFPSQSIVVMNMVNGWTGYLPPEDVYHLDMYQVWQTPFRAGSLERVIKAATAAIVEMKP